MDKKSLMKYALIGGGAYLVYWYITNYGPGGAATNSSGQKIGPSYWDTWFGATTAQPTTAASIPASTSTAVVQTPAPAPAPAPTPTQTTSTGAVSATVMATPAQVAQIMGLLQASDIPAFQAMVPTLTYQVAQSMIQTAAACQSKLITASGSCATVTPTVSQSNPTSPASLVQRIRAQAIGSANLGSDSATVSQWNWFVSSNWPSAQLITVSTSAGDNKITAQQYADLRTSLGLSDPSLGMSGMNGMGAITPAPVSYNSTSSQRLQGVPKKSPWGKLPTGGYLQ